MSSPVLRYDSYAATHLNSFSPLRPNSAAAASPLLSSVCLCAIVKDELMNPSGGIAAYLDRTLPFVHTAVIVDTGSSDGTLELLMERSKRLDSLHLHVFQVPFVSFAQARNFALQKAFEVQESQAASSQSDSSTDASPFRHILILDADEKLTFQSMSLLAATLAMDKRSCFGAGMAMQVGGSSGSSGSTGVQSSKELSTHFGEEDFLSASGDSDESSEDLDEQPPPHRQRHSISSSFSPSTPQAQGRSSQASVAAAEQDAATLSAVFSAVMPSLPSSAFYCPPALSSAYPVAIKFSCHCFDASGVSTPRSNSGLWNPRVFSADRRFSFINLVDDYRFERLMFDGREVAQSCYVREGDLPFVLRQQYAQVRSEAGVASSATEIATANVARARHEARLNAIAIAATSAGNSDSDGNSRVYHHHSSSSTPSSLSPATSAAFPPRGLYGEAECGGEEEEGEEETFSSASSHSQPLLLPMHHFIPSLAGRRKKNAQYKAGGEKAKRLAASAMSAPQLSVEEEAGAAEGLGSSSSSDGSTHSQRSATSFLTPTAFASPSTSPNKAHKSRIFGAPSR